MESLNKYKHKRIVKAILLAATLMLVTLFFFIPYITEEYTTKTIVAYAKNSVKQIKLTRAYYVKSVVDDVKKYAPELTFSYAHEGVNGILPLPTTLIHNLSAIFSKNTGIAYNLYSEYPFKNRANRVLTPFQKEAIAFTKTHKDGLYIKRDVLKGKEVLRVATTDYMTDPSCVKCHNNHPDRTWEKGHWKLGDKRGVLEVTVPIDLELAAHKKLRNYILFFIAVIFASVLFYLYRVLRDREQELLTVTNELELEMEAITNMMDEHVIISKTDSHGVITYASQAFIDISGYSKEELLGKPHRIVRHPDEAKEKYDTLWKTIKAKKTWQGDLKNRAKDGSTYYVHATIFPILNEAKELIEYVAFRDDITQRVLSQKALEKEKHLNQIVSDNQQSILLMTNQEDGVLSVNKKFFDVFGFKDFKDFKSKHNCICELFIDKEGYLKTSNDTSSWIDIPLKAPQKMYKALMKNKYGEERIFSVRIKEVLLEDEIFYVSTFTDITELEEAREMAESSEKLKTAFMANMSHEIRTPMNGISGFLQLLQKTRLNEKQQKYISIIEASMKNLLGIIHDILDFSKLEDGKMQLSLIKINPFVDFSKALALFKPSAEKKNIIYTIHIDPKIDQCLYADRLRITQVLSNLVSNAMKFTQDHGSIDINISLVSKDKTHNIIGFAVTDTGIGIPKDRQKKIFEAFSQADSSTTRKFGGTGLGLSISTSLVKMLGGELVLKSEEEKGSTFSFEIALEICPNLQHEIFTDSLAIEDNEKENHLKVLVAEDYEMNTMLIDEMLKEYGIHAHFVVNGKEAVALLKKEKFDIVLMDINMPEMNGIDATRIIRERGDKVPIIALTANALEGDKEKFLAYGMNDYISKPIDMDRLYSVLDKYSKRK